MTLSFSRRLPMRTSLPIAMDGSSANSPLDTRSSPTPRNVLYTMPAERRVCQSREVWVAWIPRYALAPIAVHSAHHLTLPCRICSASSLVVVEDSLAAAEEDQVDRAEQRISSIASMYPSKTSTRARPPSSRSLATSFAASARARVERRAPSGRAILVTVGVSRLRCARWVP